MAAQRRSEPLTIDTAGMSIDTVTTASLQGGTSDGERQSLSDSRTTGYVVKKITASSGVRHGLVDTKSGIHAVSIDTGSFGGEPAHKSPAKQTASIDTDVFINPTAQQRTDCPLVIDETDVMEDRVVMSKPAQAPRRERPAPRSISLDISSDIETGVMPSVERQDRLGTGVVAGVLGSGGMAKVYKIWNDKLEVFRAVKVLLPTTQKEQLDRFLTEAKITAKLRHHNIIETYDCSDWHGLPTIEMELVEGNTLAALVGACAILPSPVTVAIALQVAAALSYAHSQEILIYGKTYRGIIHRDLKPSNIMVAPSGRVTLMDFGVARPVETGLHTVVADSIVGTIHYFSPEQIGGYPIDHLTDVYSFGAVLYELLCGKNPFPYSNMVSMIQAKTKNQFMRLEEYPVAMDGRVASVAQTCLRTDKRERYPDFNAVSSVLEEILLSYGMGSPEEVVAVYLANPAKMQLEYERYCAMSAKKRERESDVEELTPVAEPSAHETAPVERHEPKVGWEPPRRSRTALLTGVLIAALLLIVAGIFFAAKADGGKRVDGVKMKMNQVKVSVERVLARNR